MVLPFLIFFLTQVKGYSIEVAGGLLTLLGCGNILGSWIGGRLSDRIGAGNVLIWSFILSAASISLVPKLSTIFSIGGALFAFAVANGVFRPAYDACVVRLCPPEERSRAYAVYVVAINIGAGVAASVAGYLYSFKPGLIFYADALTSIFAAMIVFFFLDRRSGLPVAFESSANLTSHSNAPYKSTPFLMACLAVCVLDAVVRQTSSTLPLYVSANYGMTPQIFGNLLTVGYVIFAASILPVSNWVKSRNLLGVAVFGMCIVALGFGALPFGSNIAAFALLYLLMTVGQLFFYPAIMAIVMGHAAQVEGKSGTYMGFYRTTQAAAGVAAPVVGTFVYVHAAPQILWFGCAALIVLAAFALGVKRNLDNPGLAREPILVRAREK